MGAFVVPFVVVPFVVPFVLATVCFFVFSSSLPPWGDQLGLIGGGGRRGGVGRREGSGEKEEGGGGWTKLVFGGVWEGFLAARLLENITIL